MLDRVLFHLLRPPVLFDAVCGNIRARNPVRQRDPAGMYELEKFSKLSAAEHVLCKVTIQRTSENVYRAKRLAELVRVTKVAQVTVLENIILLRRVLHR